MNKKQNIYTQEQLDELILKAIGPTAKMIKAAPKKLNTSVLEDIAFTYGSLEKMLQNEEVNLTFSLADPLTETSGAVTAEVGCGTFSCIDTALMADLMCRARGLYERREMESYRRLFFGNNTRNSQERV